MKCQIGLLSLEAMRFAALVQSSLKGFLFLLLLR